MNIKYPHEAIDGVIRIYFNHKDGATSTVPHGGAVGPFRPFREVVELTDPGSNGSPARRRLRVQHASTV